MVHNYRWLLLSATLCVLTAACSSLPQSGPSAQDVKQQASNPDTQTYEVVDIDAETLAITRLRAPDSFYTGFAGKKPTRTPVLGVGDVVTITIWEPGSGGVFSPAPGPTGLPSATGGVTIPQQAVNSGGRIFVPYAGEVIAAGKTPEQVQAEIVGKLAGKAVDPQVLVTIAQPISNTVTIGGEVVAGARVPLNLKGDKLLDVIATAGGVRVPVDDTAVHLSRDNRTVKVPLRQVIDNPRENIAILPGDSITLVRDQQTFIAYGATGRNAEIPFETNELTLTSALVKAGGLIDSRSDPSGVFLLRYEPEFVARKLKPDSSLIVAGGYTPIVYRLDMRKTESIFLSRTFPVFNHDVIYVSNAPITDVQKAMQIFVLIAQPATTAASLSTAL